jgi:hypothetical protein
MHGIALGLLIFICSTGEVIGSTQAFSIPHVFTNQPVWKVQIEIAPENIDRLRKNSRSDVHASVRLFDQTFADVGIHLKGSGSFRPIDEKPNLTLDFSRYVRDQAFYGFSKIHLNNSVEDGSYLKEQIGSEMFRAAQLPAPLVSHALVELNGKSLGLYVAKEGFTESFICRFFTNTTGNIYDINSCIHIESYINNQTASPSSATPLELQRLATAAGEPLLSNRWQRLQQSIDVRRFVNYMAMEVLIGHWDGYCLGKNNFRIYADPESQKLFFLPTGMDQVFSKADMPWKPQMAGLVARSILEIPEGENLYAQAFQSLLNTVLIPERLTNRVRQHTLALKPYLSKKEYESVEEESFELCRQITEREKYLRHALHQSKTIIPLFIQNMANLQGWNPDKTSENVKFLDLSDSKGNPALYIQVKSAASASWRTTLRLSKGNYRFQGEAKVSNVKTLPFGRHQGASLRIAGKSQRSNALMVNNGGELLFADFAVALPQEEIILACELRASSGEAWFKKDTLVLIRN